jgi:hypothetical protein
MTTPEAIATPDTKLCKEITEVGRDTESELLFNHSSRVYCFAALTGQRRGLSFDRELLYAGAMFHDMGLMPKHSSRTERFEVDGANAARGFLKAHSIDQKDIDLVWTAIALHTTPGIPVYMHPVVALVTAGSRGTFSVSPITNSQMSNAMPSSLPTRARPVSKKPSYRLFMTGLNTNQTPRSAM